MKNCLLLFLLCATVAQAQQLNQVHKCYTNEHLDFLHLVHPGLKENIKQTFETAQAHAEQKASIKSLFDTTYRIPVVFHVVYNGSIQNLDQALLESQIEVLNEDFNRLNIDTANTRTIFKDRASSVGFEFFLATIDPDGNPTNGITRTPTTEVYNFFDLDAMKNASTGKAAWDTDEYLNIWVCDLGGFILGFAYPPSAAPNWPAGQSPSSVDYEGVVLHYEIVGRNNPLATGQLAIADQGRSAVHEVGHFWGLRHIWGDSGNPFAPGVDCDLSADDGFSDTPHAGNNSQATGCNFSKNTCINSEAPDEPDMIENYMDYSTETCQNMFTEQQANLMRSMAVIGRPNLANVIKDENINIAQGQWIVLNNTDTFFLDGNSSVNINAGDEVMFLNMNNGFNYTASNGATFNANDEVILSEEGNVSFSSDPNSIRSQEIDLVQVYPNPAQNLIQISNPQGILFNSVKIISITGQVVLEIALIENLDLKISIQAIHSGAYFLQFVNQSEIIGVKKLNILP